jgi:hypothetical protein
MHLVLITFLIRLNCGILYHMQHMHVRKMDRLKRQEILVVQGTPDFFACSKETLKGFDSTECRRRF